MSASCNLPRLRLVQLADMHSWYHISSSKPYHKPYLNSNLWFSSSCPLRLLTTLNSLQCNAAINQLARGRNREENETSELPSLAATTLMKDYKQRAPSKLPLLTSTLRNMKLSSWLFCILRHLIILFSQESVGSPDGAKAILRAWLWYSPMPFFYLWVLYSLSGCNWYFLEPAEEMTNLIIDIFSMYNTSSMKRLLLSLEFLNIFIY